MVAVGLTIVFGILEVVNFAQGEFYMLGAYLAYLVILAQLPYPLGIVAAVVGMTVIGLLTERQMASTASRSNGKETSFSATITSPDPSSAQPTASSMTLVECGSETISPKKNCDQSAYSRSQ